MKKWKRTSTCTISLIVRRMFLQARRIYNIEYTQLSNLQLQFIVTLYGKLSLL